MQGVWLSVYPYDPAWQAFTTKVNAVLWYLSGVSMNRIAFLSRLSVQAVLNWIKPRQKLL